MLSDPQVSKRLVSSRLLAPVPRVTVRLGNPLSMQMGTGGRGVGFVLREEHERACVMKYFGFLLLGLGCCGCCCGACHGGTGGELLTATGSGSGLGGKGRKSGGEGRCAGWPSAA